MYVNTFKLVTVVRLVTLVPAYILHEKSVERMRMFIFIMLQFPTRIKQIINGKNTYTENRNT